MIPVFRPSTSQEEIEATTEVLLSGWWGLGKKTAELEKKFAEFTGSKYALGTNSGTAALHLSLLALGIKDGEVITPALTFVSTALVVRYVGAKVVFCDVDEETLCLDPTDLAKKITPRTKAVIVVHYGGHPADMRAIKKIAGKIPIIEDCAHAAGSYLDGRHVGTFGTLGAFSFHPVKNIATPDGGMVICNSQKLYKKLIPLRWCGIDQTTWARVKTRYNWNYKIKSLGYKYHMNDVAAAIALVQLKRLKELNSKRRQIAEKYNQAFLEIPWIITPKEAPNIRSSWHIYAIRCQKRNGLIDHLGQAGIGASAHYRPLNTYPKLFPKLNLPVTSRVWKSLVTLPLFPDMTDEEVEKVITAVKSFR